jgi:hypothetical protein
MRFPREKIIFDNMSPSLRPYISVSFPQRGWIAALAMKKVDTSHGSRDNEPKVDDIGADSVAIMEESTATKMIPRNMPLVALVISSVEGSFEKITSPFVGNSPLVASSSACAEVGLSNGLRSVELTGAAIERMERL